MSVKVKSILIAIVVLVALTERLVFFGVLGGFDLRAWHLLLLIAAIVIGMHNKFVIPAEMRLVFIFLVTHSVVVFLILGSLSLFTIIQIILFCSTVIILFSLVRYIGLVRAIKTYQLAAITLSICVILENILHAYFGVMIYSTEVIGPFVKARGVLTEPSEAAILIAPAVLSALVWTQYYRACILITGVLLSFSSLAFISLGTVFGLYWLLALRQKNRSVIIVSSGIIMIPILFVMLSLPATQSRVDSSIASVDVIGSTGNEIEDYKRLSGSVATIALNAQVALRSALDTYGLGIGFGNFRGAFNKYASHFVDIRFVDGLFYNQASGGSLLIRSIAELGIFGAFVVLYMIIKTARVFILYTKKAAYSEENKIYVLASGMVLVVLIGFIIRKDMWFSFNLSFFLGMLFCVPKVKKVSLHKTVLDRRRFVKPCV